MSTHRVLVVVLVIGVTGFGCQARKPASPPIPEPDQTNWCTQKGWTPPSTAVPAEANLPISGPPLYVTIADTVVRIGSSEPLSDPHAIQAELRRQVKDEPYLHLVLRADPSLPHSRVLDVMEWARKEGIYSFSVDSTPGAAILDPPPDPREYCVDKGWDPPPNAGVIEFVGKSPDGTHTATIRITPDGAALEAEPLSHDRAALIAGLSARIREHPRHGVRLLVTPDVPYGRVFEIAELARELGAEPLSLGIRPPGRKP